jgi:hypothetical protein
VVMKTQLSLLLKKMHKHERGPRTIRNEPKFLEEIRNFAMMTQVSNNFATVSYIQLIIRSSITICSLASKDGTKTTTFFTS